MTHDDNSLICLLDICVALVRCLSLWLVLNCFKLSCSFFLFLNFKNSFYILGTSPLTDMCFAKIFSKCSLPFHSLNSVFWRTQVFHYTEVQFNFFHGLYIKSRHQTQGQIDFFTIPFLNLR